MPVLCTGGFQTAAIIEEAIARGDCDAVTIARPLIANNDLVQQFAQRHRPPGQPVHLLQQMPRQRRRESARAATTRAASRRARRWCRRF